MLLNIILLILGALFLFYGIKNQLKFWIVIGSLLLCFGAVSAIVDYCFPGTAEANNARIPFILDHFAR